MPDLFDDGLPGATKPENGYTLAEYIDLLLNLRREGHGQLVVQKWTPAKGRINAKAPKLAYARKVPARDGTSAEVVQFWDETMDPEAKGRPVIRI